MKKTFFSAVLTGAAVLSCAVAFSGSANAAAGWVYLKGPWPLNQEGLYECKNARAILMHEPGHGETACLADIDRPGYYLAEYFYP
ncbi:hypothetical protein [Allokutzneria oryzae]|uniref:Uncharacterized protein n=1 Tax=Allokutzneria oryzae TaxID=1378989 RepID=A0ABV5ZVP1_9PSEU